MKKKSSLVIMIILSLLLININTIAQEFTTQIESTDKYAGYFIPLKAGSFLQFTIKVKSNVDHACTVYLDKGMMGNISSWITIDNNNQVIIKDQVISFLVNINVPANTLEGFYSLFINFKALGADGSNHFFEHFTQNIIIDNSAPDIPTFTVSKDKYTVALYNIYSTDYFSAFYTNINGNSGYNGIKSYTVSILENDVNAADPQSFNATTKDYCDFKSLKANTQYKVVVDAYDLVGLKNSKFEYVLTPPAAPSGLNYTNTTYNSTRLNWISSPGATEYDVYKVEGIGNPYTYTKINASPIKTNYYAIAGLSPNILYKYCVVARGPAGESDRSANATVNTLALPII